MTQRTATTILVSALLGLLLAAGGEEARAGSDPPKKSLSSQCADVWNDSSAKDSCSNRILTTDAGNCVIRATCVANNPAALASFEGCSNYFSTLTGQSGTECRSRVQFSPNINDIVNCNGRLRAGSSC